MPTNKEDEIINDVLNGGESEIYNLAIDHVHDLIRDEYLQDNSLLSTEVFSYLSEKILKLKK